MQILDTRRLDDQELDCPHCAEKIEKRVGELSGVKSSNLDFINKKLTIDFDGDKNALFAEIENVVHKLEPDVSVKELGDCAEKTLCLQPRSTLRCCVL